ncbi:ABC transporter ATP-binding protein [Treponema pedis]|uniref:ABC transporter ATP-binding protein n=1 Tax=Treponema pedis TaxID=409322 RepID=UPI0020905914|nr:ABC transporter ATP-binding protein [Treponema pedis]
MIIKRFFKMIVYCETTEKMCLLNSIFFYLIEAVRPFFILYLSKIIIEAVIQKTAMEKILPDTVFLLAAFMLLSVISGIFENRAEYRLKRFLKKHNMKKALNLLNLNYEFTEKNKLQNELTSIKQLERFLVFYPNDFIKKTGMLIGGITGAGVALYFAKKLFNGQGFGNISGFAINIIFLVILITSSIITFFSANYIYKKFGEHISEKTKKTYRYLNTFLTLIYDYKTGKDIRLYNNDLAKNYSLKYQAIQKTSHNFMAKFFSITIGAEKILDGAIFCIVVLFVGVKALYGSIPLSEVFFYIGVLNIFSSQIYEASDAINTIIPSDKYRKMLFNFYNLKNTKPDGTVIPEKENGLLFEFKNVSFKYPDTEKYVIKNLNLTLDFRKKLALVGKNGSGKSTIVKLLIRLYDPTEGEILLNGINIKEYNYEEYIKIFSVVFQDFKLLALTAGQNIASANEYDKERATDALLKTGMKKFYEKHGLDSYLYQNFETNGIEISGGEAQKIAMARAIYHQGDVFILDEPTAALDPISEAEIYMHFDGITLNNTAVYISHRLSSCKFCDRIAVMDNGKLIQYGKHDELVADTSGKYYELWNAQAKYYRK